MVIGLIAIDYAAGASAPRARILKHFCCVKPSWYYQYSLRTAYASSLRTACYAAAASRQTLQFLADNPGVRFVDACNAVNCIGEPFLDPSFVFARFANKRQAAEEVLVGYGARRLILRLSSQSMHVTAMDSAKMKATSATCHLSVRRNPRNQLYRIVRSTSAA